MSTTLARERGLDVKMVPRGGAGSSLATAVIRGVREPWGWWASSGVWVGCLWGKKAQMRLN